MPEEETKPESQGRKIPVKSLLILLTIVLLEAGVFGLWMMLGGPSTAGGATDVDVSRGAKYGNTTEMKILDSQYSNTMTGPMHLYHLEIRIVCAKDKAGLVEKVTVERGGQIRDTVRAVIASADPKHLDGEPQLTTLKRQIKAAFDEIFGEGVVDKVLIPVCVRGV